MSDGKALKKDGIKNGSDYYSSLVFTESNVLLMIRSNSVDQLNTASGNIQYFNDEINLKSEVPFLNTYIKDAHKITFVHDNQIFTYYGSNRQKLWPDIIIDGIEVNLSKVDGRKSFNQDENNVLFHFTASWLMDADKITYAFRLEGFDQEWRVTRDRTVSYPKLPPGDYTFKVKASANGLFIGDETVASYYFVVGKYFYRSFWFISMVVCAALLLAFLYWNNRKRNQFQKSEIDRKHVESQLENLKSQLNPHFLFNSFNTLVGLIEEDDKERSLSFVENLTDFYRLVLEHGKRKVVLFEDELRLVKHYINLLNERFEDSISLEISDAFDDCWMPPLVLQLLVENAVKHNEFNNENKMTIRVYRSEGWIVISNNIRPKQYVGASSGSGLENIKKRYMLLSNKEIKVEKSESDFLVKLPVLTGSSSDENAKLFD